MRFIVVVAAVSAACGCQQASKAAIEEPETRSFHVGSVKAGEEVLAVIGPLPIGPSVVPKSWRRDDSIKVVDLLPAKGERSSFLRVRWKPGARCDFGGISMRSASSSIQLGDRSIMLAADVRPPFEVKGSRYVEGILTATVVGKFAKPPVILDRSNGGTAAILRQPDGSHRVTYRPANPADPVAFVSVQDPTSGFVRVVTGGNGDSFSYQLEEPGLDDEPFHLVLSSIVGRGDIRFWLPDGVRVLNAGAIGTTRTLLVERPIGRPKPIAYMIDERDSKSEIGYVIVSEQRPRPVNAISGL